MNTRIYRTAKFLRRDDIRDGKSLWLKRRHRAPRVNPAEYTEIFRGEIAQTDMSDILERFRHSPHPLFRGRAIEPTDIVVNDTGAFYVDTDEGIPVDFDESQTSLPEKTFRIVYVEPDYPAYASRITDSTDGIEAAVAGPIDPAYLSDSICIIGNRYGVIDGLPPNRTLQDGTICGNFLIIGVQNGDYRDLTDDETVEWMRRFAVPEFCFMEKSG